MSPIGTLYVERYDDVREVRAQLDARRRAAGGHGSARRAAWDALAPSGSLRVVPCGANQHPKLDDYADGVDTVQFLLSLKGEEGRRNFAP